MKNNRYTLYKAYNFLKLLYDRPNMKRNLVRLLHYHSGVESSDFSNTKNKLLKEILEYAKIYCPYYKELFESHKINVRNIDDFDIIPFLDKEIIKLNIKSLQSNNLKRVTNYIMNTGGTTGTPLTFPVSSHFDNLHQVFAFKLLGYNNGDKIIAVDGTKICEKNIKKNIYWKKMHNNAAPYGSIAFSSLYITNDTIQHYIDQLNIEKPMFVRGYPTAINYLAVYIIENGIDLSFKLKGIQLTAETIFEEQISNIQKAFKCKVGLQYGHSEVSVFAYTIDDTYEYYCSPFYGNTEVIGVNGKHVEIGEIGEIVVTGFYNKAMPFIRYKTDDLALYDGTVDGIVKLRHIYGRNQDYLFDEFGEKVFLIGLIYGGHHEFLNHIKKWQIIQNQFGHITIKIVAGNSFSKVDEKSIEELFLKNNGIISIIDVVEEIQLTERGKTKFVIQNAG
ncbi:MAG: hypothetical protein ACD_77C00103G0020 [uncultured bacterium]|nr:MAG: hypothetical protein ACD_77C00103G0020 [uncultured bacterium]